MREDELPSTVAKQFKKLCKGFGIKEIKEILQGKWQDNFEATVFPTSTSQERRQVKVEDEEKEEKNPSTCQEEKKEEERKKSMSPFEEAQVSSPKLSPIPFSKPQPFDPEAIPFELGKFLASLRDEVEVQEAPKEQKEGSRILLLQCGGGLAIGIDKGGKAKFQAPNKSPRPQGDGGKMEPPGNKIFHVRRQQAKGVTT